MIVEHRTVGRTLTALAWPTLAAIVGDQLLGIADTIVVGKLGPGPLAAMTAAVSVYVALALAVHGISRGVTILGAQAIGAQNPAGFGRIVRASLAIPLGLAFALALLALRFAHPGIALLLGPIPTAADGGTYLLLRCLALPAMVLSSVAVSAFGAAGDTRFGFRLLVAINLVHIPLLIVLALGVGTGRPLGIAGAGISSLCAEAIGAVYALISAWRRPALSIFRRERIAPALVWRVFVLGLPEAIYLFLIVAPDIAIVAILAPLGAETVAAFRVLTIVSDTTWSVPGSIGEATQIVLGQRFGARDPLGARRFERGALRYGIGLSAACGIIVAAAAWPIAFGCTLAAAVASSAALPLAIHMLTMPLKGYAMVGIARVRAAGDTRFSMLVGIGASAIVIGGTRIGIEVAHLGLYAVPAAWIVAWICWCAATALRLHRFDWRGATLAA